MEDLANSSRKLRLHISPIETLPQELLLQVLEHLVHPFLIAAGSPDNQDVHHSNDCLEGDGPVRYGRGSVVDRMDLRNVCLVSRNFKLAATTVLYRCAHLATAKSPTSFLLSLMAYPDLQPLIKHITVPPYVKSVSERFDFTFTRDMTNWRFASQVVIPLTQLEAELAAERGKHVDRGLLRLLMPLVPNLRTLHIPQPHLMDGPFINDLALHNLTTLRITVMLSSEVISSRYHSSYADRPSQWLCPDIIGNQFPALQRFEIWTPSGRWEASLVSKPFGAADGRSSWKYVESLTTTTTCPLAPAEWDLMSLRRRVFISSKLRALKLDGPGKRCGWTSWLTGFGAWNLNLFFITKGRSLRTLSLDWECRNIGDCPPDFMNPLEVHFGPAACLTTLDKLTNLTHLTVSLQVLFSFSTFFKEWMEALEADPDTELSQLFPPSIKTLRIAEYIPGVYEPDAWSADDSDGEMDDFNIAVMRDHSDLVYRFLQVLRSCWMLGAEGRELWFRRRIDLDSFAVRSQDPMGRDGLSWILEERMMAENDGFSRVWGLHEYHGNNSDWDEEEMMGVSDLESTENKHENSDGESDQAQDG